MNKMSDDRRLKTCRSAEPVKCPKPHKEQLSYLGNSSRRRPVIDPEGREDESTLYQNVLETFLRNLSPFNGRWILQRKTRDGAEGMVFEAVDNQTQTPSVIKVAKRKNQNNPAIWEGFMFEKVQKNESASVVRILDRGILPSPNDAEGKNSLIFMVLEKTQLTITEYIDKYSGEERKLHVTYIMLDMLKGIYDLHMEGILHRDLNSDSMGILSAEKPFVLLFDLGLTRLYTDQHGHQRKPRTTTSLRGTKEWTSGHSIKCREQSRIDDLIGWLYTAAELYNPVPQKVQRQQLPWFSRNSDRVRFRYYVFDFQVNGYLRGTYSPARHIFRYAPAQFLSVNAYLMTIHRMSPPNYRFIANKVNEAINELKKATGCDRFSEPTPNTIPIIDPQ